MNVKSICFLSMDRLIKEFGNIPITTSIIESLYPKLKCTERKVAWLENQGYIIRLKRGLYVVNPKYSGVTLSSELIANHLYAPSYISMSSALRYYGLILDRDLKKMKLPYCVIGAGNSKERQKSKIMNRKVTKNHFSVHYFTIFAS